MEFSDFILAAVGAVSSISAWVVKSLVSDVKKLDDKMNACQSSMPKEYMLKVDYHDDAKEIKESIREQSKKIDQIWKSLRTDK
mgnify:CR=1 FL=1